ncbi:SusC/RagA family TonB-linked outer membrane protein [Maribellus comscasis]|uniref:SusC/RagA family TonB-linked outer membrane protein n=1 Tax=Maribellus comscasis TaxID=2681766 RepID=A0A6I6K7G0_9BACT|nr:TonB-dependent receptor [Maribellus comscasis]QGY47573.1 SusC/RagA family TonB-linked outer membrane protein [Maribellus comscasis]
MKKNVFFLREWKIPGLQKVLRIMKLTTFFILLSVITAFAGKSYSQTKSLNIKMNSSTVKEVLKNIENQSEFVFMYSEILIDVNREVSIEIRNKKIGQVLNVLFEGTNVIYKVKDRFVLLTTTEFDGNELFGQQQKSVSGIVNDKDGQPLPGVTVVVKGTTQGTVTNATGKYTLNGIPDNSTLVFSFVGMQALEVEVGGQPVINVSMNEETIGLEEVVAIGYGIQKKESLTGAISGIQADEIEAVKASTVSATLSGQIPGVSFRQSDGRPGSTASVQIRNFGDPLVIIDGVEKDLGTFNNISPNDIESMSVLKDASAAIYGLRAAGGVIIVTTKRGAKNTANKINVTLFQGFQDWMRKPQSVNAYEWMRGKVRAEMNAVNPSTSITQEELSKWEQGTEYGYQSFDWVDFIIEPWAPQTSANINMSGGSDKINYYTSISHFRETSVFGRENKFYRTNIQQNIDVQITDRLSLGTTINGRIEVTDHVGVPWGDDYIMPQRALYRSRPTERPYANDNPDYINNIGHNENNWALFTKDISGYSTDKWRVFQSNFDLKYDLPIDGLKLKATYSYYMADELFNEHEYTYETFTYDPQSEEYNMTFSMTNPWRRREHQKVLENVAQFNLNYNKQFGDHNIQATFVNEYTARHIVYTRYNSTPGTNALLLMYDEDLKWFYDEDYEEARIGYVGRFNYSFGRRFYFEAVGRYDGSWKFAPDKRWGFFPSVSAGWRITEENFMEDIADGIGLDLKIRGSYGVVGDDAVGIGAYDYLTGYNYAQSTVIIDDVAVSGSRDKGVPVTNISWFENRIFDIGIDYSLFNNKVSGAIDYFNRKRTGLLGEKYDILVPSELGYSLPDENVNSDAVLGMDGSVVYNGKAGDLSFSLGLNATLARSRNLETYKPRFGSSWDYYRNSTENRWDGITWGYEVEGQFQSMDEIRNYDVDIDGVGNTTLLPGDLIYKDVNNDGVINSYDVRPIGYQGGAQPILSLGFINNFKYKNFDLQLNLATGSGYSFVISNWNRVPYYSTGTLLERFYNDSWYREDPYDVNSEWHSGTYPALRYNATSHSNYNKTSTFWLVNVWYLRARTIELGYSLPESILEKIRFDKLRVFVNAYNLFSIDNMSKYDLDPEVSSIDNQSYPQHRTIKIGVDLTF